MNLSIDIASAKDVLETLENPEISGVCIVPESKTLQQVVDVSAEQRPAYFNPSWCIRSGIIESVDVWKVYLALPYIYLQISRGSRD